MNHKDHISSDARSAIDACRPDSDDYLLPEVVSATAKESPRRVEAVRRSIQRIDRAIMTATQKVPVPEGLADRILAGFPSSSIAPSPIAAAAPSRRLMLIGAGLAMAASLLIALVVRASRETVDVASAESQARDFYDLDDHSAALAAGEFPTPLPAAMVPGAVLGWRESKLFGKGDVAYELVYRGVKATLYVLPARSLFGPRFVDLPGSPQPQSTSGMVAAAWTEGAYVYVMVTQGGERGFGRFFSRTMA
jgi:hypothetical protein